MLRRRLSAAAYLPRGEAVCRQYFSGTRSRSRLLRRLVQAEDLEGMSDPVRWRSVVVGDGEAAGAVYIATRSDPAGRYVRSPSRGWANCTA